MLRKHSKFFESLLLLTDLATVAACWVAAYGFRFFLDPIPAPRGIPALKPYLVLLLPMLLIWPVVFRVFGLYRPRRIGTRLGEIADIAKACSVSVLLLTALTFFVREFEFSRLVLLYFWLLSTAGLSLVRGAFRESLRFVRRQGYNLRFAVLVGWGEVADEVVRRLGAHPELGIRLRGCFLDPAVGGAAPGGLPVLGPPDAVPRFLREKAVDHVFVALPLDASSRLPEVLNGLDDAIVDIRVVPDFSRYMNLRGGIEEFEGLPFICLQGSPVYGWDRLAKRSLDVVVSACLLVLLSPLLALIAALIRGTSPGPVFFRQERMGLDGRTFSMLKFRSMRADAEDETGPVWAQAGDARRTRAGAFLRTASLDELPQLWNVFKGEMSLVGPRPERPVFIKEFRQRVPRYMLRHTVKAGITGWAQVNGWRGNTSIEKRIEHDLYYIEHWSLLFDLKILWLTLWKGLVSRNAY
jgi:Undecaprenyl-phosphate glucose phosphotransferase